MITSNLTHFVKMHRMACLLTCGIALGYLGYRAVKWLFFDNNYLSSLFKKTVSIPASQTNEPPLSQTTKKITTPAQSAVTPKPSQTAATDPTKNAPFITTPPQNGKMLESQFVNNITYFDKFTSDDLLLLIFSYLNLFDRNLQTISKKFKINYLLKSNLKLENDQILKMIKYCKPECSKVKELNLTVTTNSQPLFVIKFFLSLEKLTLLSYFSIKGAHIFTQNLQLKHLKLGDPFETEYLGRSNGRAFYTCTDFEPIVQYNSLTHLSINSISFSYRNIQALANLTQLKTLELVVQIYSLTSEEFYTKDQSALAILESMPAKIILEISRSDHHPFLSEWDKKFLIDLFTKFSHNIRVLDYNLPQIAYSKKIQQCLQNHPLNQCRAVSLCVPLSMHPYEFDLNPFLNRTTFPNLEVLALEHVELNHGFDMKNLKKLSLDFVTVCVEFWTAFISNFSEKLQVLRLCNMRLSDKSIIPILKKGRFTELNLSYNTSITDETLFIIAETQTKLIKLHLYDTSVTLKGLAALKKLNQLNEIIIKDKQKRDDQYVSWESTEELPKSVKILPKYLVSPF